MRCLYLALAGLILAAALVPAAGRADDEPVVYAHRGGAKLGPENTMGAFEQAHDTFEGVWLEMDTQLTLDGVLVIIHDHTLDRTTSCTGRVADMTADAVTACDASESFDGWPDFEPVPTAEEVLETGKAEGWRILMEIKNIPTEGNFDPSGIEAADALVRLIDDVGFPEERFVVQSFFPTSLDRIETLNLLRDTPIRTALLTTSQLPGAPPGVGFYATENALYSTARGYEIVAPDHTSPDLSADTVETIHALGRMVVVWTVDEPPDIEDAIGWGVDGIISDRPDLVYAAL